MQVLCRAVLCNAAQDVTLVYFQGGHVYAAGAGVRLGGLATFERGAFDLKSDLNNLTEKGIDVLRTELAALDLECAEELRKSVHANYMPYITASQVCCVSSVHCSSLPHPVCLSCAKRQMPTSVYHLVPSDVPLLVGALPLHSGLHEVQFAIYEQGVYWVMFRVWASWMLRWEFCGTT